MIEVEGFAASFLNAIEFLSLVLRNLVPTEKDFQMEDRRIRHY